MRRDKINNILGGVSPDERKVILNRLVSVLISGLNEGQKREIIETVLSRRKEGKQLEAMVEQ